METKKHDKHKAEESSLLGTAIGVGFVGIIIFISYITLYGLYLDRV